MFFYCDKNYKSKQNGINVAYKQRSYVYHSSVQEVSIHRPQANVSVLERSKCCFSSIFSSSECNRIVMHSDQEDKGQVSSQKS